MNGDIDPDLAQLVNGLSVISTESVARLTTILGHVGSWPEWKKQSVHDMAQRDSRLEKIHVCRYCGGTSPVATTVPHRGDCIVAEALKLLATAKDLTTPPSITAIDFSKVALLMRPDGRPTFVPHGVDLEPHDEVRQPGTPPASSQD